MSRARGPWAALFSCAVVIVGRDARADPPGSYLERGIVAAVVRRAISHANLGTEVTRDLAARARAAGWVPHFGLRVVRGLGVSAASATDGYVNTDHATAQDSWLVDLRADFNLDRVLFDPHEVAIARVESLRSEHRSTIERHVVDLLVSMERARLVCADPASSDDDRARAHIELLRARTLLEVATGSDFDQLTHERPPRR